MSKDEVPDSLDEAMPKVELGGAIGRLATVECRQGQHDLCHAECDCRCHEKMLCGKIGHDAERIVWMCVLPEGHDGDCSYEQRIGHLP